MPFEARPLPEMIDLNGEIVAGPFCTHCGYPFSLHSPDLLCPSIPNAIMGPSCQCHQIQTIDVKHGRHTVKQKMIVRVTTSAASTPSN